MAGYSSLYGREISEKIWDIEYEPFIKVCPKNVYLKYSVTQKSVNRLIKCILTLRVLMSYIYGAPILDVSRSHTTTHHSR
jgi:hypothetical protein